MMEATSYKATFVRGVLIIALTDPPKLAKREGNPPVTVDEPKPESVAYGLLVGLQWEAGAGLFTTKHDKKRSDGTRLVKETLERGSVLRSSNDGLRLKIVEGGEVDVVIVRGEEPLVHKLDVIERTIQFALPVPSPVAQPVDELQATTDVDARLAAIHRDPNAAPAE